MRKILLVCLIILFSTLPLFAQTHTAWVRTYSGPYDLDIATEIGVDKSGNVYVGGRSTRSQYVWDYATIKYYPNGDTAWVRRYCGPKDEIAGINDLTVDDSGNVYVTGFSPDTTISHYYATIKYYPNGDTAWIRRYHGEGYKHDGGTAIAVDDSYNVYVTGYSSGNGIYDYGTIKYYPNGDTAWVRLYEGPRGYNVPFDLALDPWGNIYVTGISNGGSTIGDDYATIKYYPNGDTAWVRRYDGPEGGTDQAYALAVDDSGYVYVTGHSNFHETNFDYLTIKYYPNGDTAWVRRYDGTGYYYTPDMEIAVDNKGNVYVTGALYGSESNRDYTTVKYYPDGELAWVRRYNGTGNSDDYPHNLVTDNSGNIYVTGYSMNQTSSNDLVTIKYNSNGDEVCVKRYSAGVHDYLYYYSVGLAVDNAENVYVAGGTNDFITIKYFPIGMAGDTNGDDNVSLSDVVYLVSYLYKGGPSPDPIGSADVDDDESVDINDIVYLINYLFKSGPSPSC